MKLIAALFLISLSVISQNQRCGCKTLSGKSNPSMGNMLIVEGGRNLRRLEGKIIFPNYITNIEEPGKDVVVEVYRYMKADKKSEVYTIPEQHEPVASCLTGDDGKFCFKDIPSGKYVLKVGTRESTGWNGKYILVNLETRWWWAWWRRPSNEFRVVMEVAT